MFPPLRARQGSEFVLLSPEPETVLLFHVIIPVYREFMNGNLQRLLQAWSEQDRREKLNVILLINNSEAVAQDPGSSVLAENLQTLRWLRENQFPFEIDAVDLATAGIERNMGRIRQVGVERARRRAGTDDPRRHVLIHLDADTRFPKHFLERLERLYGEYARVESVFFRRDYELRGTPSTELLQSHQGFRLKRALLDFFNTRTHLSCGLATYQISSRLSAMDRVGGFRPLPEHEDVALVADLCADSVWLQDFTIEMRTEDRARPDGFTSGKRLRSLGPRKSWWRRLRDFFGPAKIAPPVAREYFLHHSLFHTLCLQVWESVKEGERSYAEAVGHLRAVFTRVLADEVAIENRELLEKPAAEIARLPDRLPVVYRSLHTVLCPTAFAFPSLILAPAGKPGRDLARILRPHLSENERIEFDSAFAAERDAHEAAVTARLEALGGFFRGRAWAETEDPFLLWCRTHLRGSHEANLEKAFPDWLGRFEESGASDVAALKIAARLLARALMTASAESSGIENFVGLLQEGKRSVILDQKDT